MSKCAMDGLACNCQPEEGVWCRHKDVLSAIAGEREQRNIEATRAVKWREMHESLFSNYLKIAMERDIALEALKKCREVLQFRSDGPSHETLETINKVLGEEHNDY